MCDPSHIKHRLYKVKKSLLKAICNWYFLTVTPWTSVSVWSSQEEKTETGYLSYQGVQV